MTGDAQRGLTRKRAGASKPIVFERFRALFDKHGRAIQAAIIAFLLFGGVGMVLVFGAPLLGIDKVNTLRLWLGSAQGVWTFPVTVAAFAALAFIGVPQVVLIGAAMVAFGPWVGSLYSWAGTLISSMIGFALGRAFGARLLRDHGGGAVRRVIGIIGDNGFMASLMIRQVPAAPFVVVNMAAGMTPMSWASFAGGTALGILPKILLGAVGGHVLAEAYKTLTSRPLGEALRDHRVLIALGLLLLGVILWAWAGWMARGWFKRRESSHEDV
ncbi:MAG: hypothetical protein JWM33_3477 [Caulobacteraceae bacterium]|nr:hypothetical protein [Caulobacteraceae bacterium]